MALKALALPALLALALLGACKEKAPPPVRTEPWPAPVVSSAPPPSRLARYKVASPSSVRFELPARRATPRGSIEVLRGHASVDLGAPSRARVELLVDLGALRMDGEQDAGEIDRGSTLRAQNWLRLGPSLPEAERERRRWATVNVTLDGVPSSGAASVFRAHATITINDFRVERSFEVRARWHYPESDAGRREPDQIDLETVRPVELSLAEHAIEPRDALGALIAEETKLLGEEVGRTAKVSVSLRLVPAE